MSHADSLYLGKSSYTVLGGRPVRHDGADKVTGKAIYAADIHLPNMAHARVVRSPHAHAIITSIDASEALKIPGVFAVVTGDDFAELGNKHTVMGEGGEVNLAFLAANCLASHKVLYRGHPVAAVAVRDLCDVDGHHGVPDRLVLGGVRPGRLRAATSPETPPTHDIRYPDSGSATRTGVADPESG